MGRGLMIPGGFARVGAMANGNLALRQKTRYQSGIPGSSGLVEFTVEANDFRG